MFIEAIAFVAPFMAPATAVFACMAYFIPPILQAILYKCYNGVMDLIFTKEAQNIEYLDSQLKLERTAVKQHVVG